MWKRSLTWSCVSIVLLAAVLAGCSTESYVAEAAREARFVRKIPWAGGGVWLKSDTHMHTRFSDGAHTVDEVAAKAVEFGCDVIAITDHGDSKLRAATKEYQQAIDDAREKYGDLIVLAGIEWNMPPWGGDEHVTALVPPGPREWNTLKVLKQRFDDWNRDQHETELADEALRWLARQADVGGQGPLLMNNHPSRQRAMSIELVADMEHWRGINDIMIGFSGAPGHQAMTPIGAYKYNERKVINRWDPAAAVVGDAWDTLLGKGYDVWGARAPSDFHKYGEKKPADYWPGQFSETWLYAPDRSAEGTFKALQAGSFFAAHGHIVRQVELRVEAEGLSRAAIPGEVIEVPVRARVAVSVDMQVPPEDWLDEPNQIDQLELIAVTPGIGAEIVATVQPKVGAPTPLEEMVVPERGLVLRARGRRTIDDGPDLMFYTNSIRITVSWNKEQRGQN
ncbi:MAG: PHP domain-containing protein [Pirellulales bacterium]